MWCVSYCCSCRIFSERKKKKQTKKNILTKHGQSIHKSPWQMWKFEITMVVLKPGCQWNTLRRKQTRAEGWETADSDKGMRRAYGGKRVGEKKVEMRINSIVFFLPFRNSCLTRCCQRNFKHSVIFIIIIKESLDMQTGGPEPSRRKKWLEKFFLFS